jgi:hypothetical protein
MKAFALAGVASDLSSLSRSTQRLKAVLPISRTQQTWAMALNVVSCAMSAYLEIAVSQLYCSPTIKID